MKGLDIPHGQWVKGPDTPHGQWVKGLDAPHGQWVKGPDTPHGQWVKGPDTPHGQWVKGPDRGGRYIGIYSLYSVTADLVGTISAILDNSIYRNPPLRAHKMQLANNGRLIFSPNGIVARWS